MNKTTKALKLAGKALGCSQQHLDLHHPEWVITRQQNDKALAAIREVLADHIAASGKLIAQHVKQEPVAWYGKSKSGNVLLSVNCVEEDWQPLYAKPVELVLNPIGEVDIYMDFLRINWKDGRHPPRGTKLYAAPVDAKAIRARGEK